MGGSERLGGQAVGVSYRTSMTAFEWALLILLSILWGGSFFFVGVAVKELPAFTIVVCRVALAALCLHVYMRIMGVRFPMDREVLLAFLVMGILNNAIPFSLIAWGQTHIASAVASMLNAATPFFTALVAHWSVYQERITVNRLAGMAVAFVGVAAMFGGELFGVWGASVWAQFAVLCACIIYAFAGVFGRRFRRLNVSPVAAAAGQVTASSLVLIPMMLVVDRPWALEMPGAATVASLVGLAVLSTAVAYLIYFHILSVAGATNLLLVTFLLPVSATLLGVFVLDEALLAKHYMGMLLIWAGLVVFDGRLFRHFGFRREPERS